jgi:lipopolysaccharide transport system permease protein
MRPVNNPLQDETALGSEQFAGDDIEVVIEPGRSFHQYWRDLWHYRELFLFLAWRDILVRYKQTAIGVAWSLIRPLVTMMVFTYVFGRLARFPSGDVPYPILVYAAVLPWQFFASALEESGNSLVANSTILSKVYFPRIIIPASSVLVGLIDFAISFFVLLLLMFFYRFIPGPRLFLLPLFLVPALLTALGAGLWLAALNVKYRDFRYVIPFIIQAGLFISPVGFTSSVVPQQWRLLYSLNPLVGIIDGFRWAILGKSFDLYWPGFVVSLCLTLLIFFAGLRYFRSSERAFADII